MTQPPPASPAPRGRLARALLAVALLPLAWVLVQAVWSIPAAPNNLAPAVAAAMPDSGVRHPLTAVLLNFRGYDTLLEVAVLLLAAWGALALAPGHGAPKGGRAHPALLSLARVAGPVMILAAGYILWAGAFRPGGAFQAGAVLGALLVVLHLAGLWRPAPGTAFRALLAAGTAVFLGAAVLAFAIEGELLRYPRPGAGLWIMAIELAATFSIAAILGLLFDRLTAAPGDEGGHA